MRISKSAIYCLASEGRITLQIPTLYIGKLPNDVVDLPDNWFCQMRYPRRPCVGREQGFLYLTKKGWDANKKDIKKAFMASQYKRGTWQDFEDYVKQHFVDCRKNIKTQIAYHQTKITQLNNIKL